MFNGVKSVNGDLTVWNVSSVVKMAAMFSYTLVFNCDLSSWNVSSATDVSGMFTYADPFDQSLSTWGNQLNHNMAIMDMFNGTKKCPYDSTAVSLSTSPPGPFCYSC
jgi:hypothetical protein